MESLRENTANAPNILLVNDEEFMLVWGEI